MDIRKIIKEELDSFDWTDDIEESILGTYILTRVGGRVSYVDVDEVYEHGPSKQQAVRIYAGDELPIKKNRISSGSILVSTLKEKLANGTWKRHTIDESVKLPIEIGDTVYMGKFKNKKTVIKTIEWNEKGDLIINGKPALKMRIPKKVKKVVKESEFDWVDSSRTPQVGETILSMDGHYSKSSGFSPLDMVVLNVDGYTDSDKICFRVMTDTPFRRCDKISEFMSNINDGTYEYE